MLHHLKVYMYICVDYIYTSAYNLCVCVYVANIIPNV